jgi:hypothetical protein
MMQCHEEFSNLNFANWICLARNLEESLHAANNVSYKAGMCALVLQFLVIIKSTLQ